MYALKVGELFRDSIRAMCHLSFMCFFCGSALVSGLFEESCHPGAARRALVWDHQGCATHSLQNPEQVTSSEFSHL